MNFVRDRKSIQPNYINIFILLSILLLGVAIKIKFAFQDSLWPDEALYLYIARNLSSDLMNLRDITGEIFYQSPPVLMYLLSFVKGLGYIEFDKAARILIVLMGAGTVLTTYFIGKKLYNPMVGIAAALFLAVCPLSNWTGVRILTDVPVVFFIYLSICMLLYEKKAAFYFFGVCAVMTKYSAFPVLFLPLILKLKPRSWVSFYLLSFVALFAFVVSKNYYSKPDGWIGYFYNFFNIPNTLHMAKEIEYFLGYFIVGFILLGIAFTVKERKFSALFHWVCIFGIFRIFLPWIVFRVSRYTLPLYPGLYIFAAYGCYRGAQLVASKWPVYSKSVNLFFIVAIAVVLGQHTFKSLGMLDGTRNTFTGYKQACEFLQGQPEPHSVATASPRQMKYFAPSFDVHDIAANVTPEKLKEFIEKAGVEYLSIDLWSPHLPSWCQSYDYKKNGYALIYKGQNIYLFKVLF